MILHACVHDIDSGWNFIDSKLEDAFYLNEEGWFLIMCISQLWRALTEGIRYRCQLGMHSPVIMYTP